MCELTEYEVIWMGSIQLLFGILPLLAFVIIDSFAGVRVGVISAVVIAIAEGVYTYHITGTVDPLTTASLLLVALLGFITYRSKNPVFFKFQPVLVGAVFSSVLLVSTMMGKPILVTLMQRYIHLFPMNIRPLLANPAVVSMFSRLNWILAIGLFLHALLVAYTALRSSKWVWIAVRSLGFYFTIFVSWIVAALVVPGLIR